MGGIRLVLFGIMGIAAQAICLWAFILAAKYGQGWAPKCLAALLAITGMLFLLWGGINAARSRITTALIPIILSAGYPVAFLLVGWVAFHGLLNDSEGFDNAYRFQLIRVTMAIACLYGIATGLLVAAKSYRGPKD